MSRASEVLATIPLANLSVIVLCCGIFLYQFLFDPSLHNFTLCPRIVVLEYQYYRVVTSALFHGGFMHIAMNMMSTAAVGSLLERRFGTFRYATTVLWGILLTSLTYILLAAALLGAAGFDGLWNANVVGFSAVLFQLSVLEANLSPNSTRSVFGFFRVPSALYPWALLVVIQVIMPHISFTGHLSGIFVGTLQLYGVLDIVMPSDEFLRRMEEEWTSLHFVTSHRSYVKVPPDGHLDSQSAWQRRDPSALRAAVGRAVGSLCKFCRDVGETIWICVFGYGRGNENIQISIQVDEEDAREPSTGVDIDEDDWVGLPPMPTPSPAPNASSDAQPESRLV